MENKYISLTDIEFLRIKYESLYKEIKGKKRKVSCKEKSFLYDYKYLDRFCERKNITYIDKKRKECKILDNINGYPLDDYQSRVVLSDEEAILVVAGAGSGKSLTIIGKIVYLVKELNVKPEDILCISFTNDATINLKKNIAKNYSFDINIYTFHKLALEILKQNGIEYMIAPDNFLSEVIDHFIDNVLPNNEKFNDSLKRILGKNYAEKDVKNLKRLIGTFIGLFKGNNYEVKEFLTILKRIKFTLNIKDRRRNKELMLLIINVYLLYQEELEKEGALDFSDMINKSIKVLKSFGIKKKWKYIIVDEYQDTSIVKFNMISELMKITGAKFLAVGDDFQSIYRFTGCDLHIFLNFTKYFHNAKVFQIVNTYRNPQELIDVAGDFVMKNKSQQRKKLVSIKHLDKPIVIYYKDDKVRALKDLLIKLNNDGCKEIMVLGRNNKDILFYVDREFKQDDSFYIFKDIKFRYLTMHKSKGLESENVILINMEDRLLGMPTKIKDEKIIKYVNKGHDYYPYEEERRLLYVGLTRTKNRTYIISPTGNESIFIKEIVKYKKNVDVWKTIKDK